MSIQVKVDGWWLSTISGWGGLKWSHAADGGCKEASWQMDLPPTFSHSALVRGSIVEIRLGSLNVWKGILTEPDVDDDWTFTALGLSSLGKGYLCLDAAGNSTSTPDTAINQASGTRGLPWSKPTSISTTPFAASDATDALNYVGDLLDAYADSVGKRWGVNAAGEVYAATDPTVPTWYLAPGAGRFGLADDDYASDIYLRYIATGGGYATGHVADTTAQGKFGRREFPVDATSMGLLSPTQASVVGNALLARGKARLGYTNGVEVTKYQLTTPGQTPACLPLVKAGDMVRMFGVLDEQGQPVPYLDWVIGESEYEAGAETVALTPVGLVERTLSDVLTVTAA